jgi:hypothetical protein
VKKSSARILCRSKIGFWHVSCVFLDVSGSCVLVDQAAQDGFSADLASVEVPCRDAGSMVFSVGDALVHAMMRAGRVVVLLVLGQDGAQVYLTHDEHTIQQLTAQRADEPLAGRVYPGSLDGGAHNYGAGGLEDGVERGGEVGAAVADQEREVLAPLAESQGEFRPAGRSTRR